MKHTECKDCKLGEGDCGYHHKNDGVVNYGIPSLSACDQYGNCMFFQRKAKAKGQIGTKNELTNLSIKSFNEFVKELPEDKNAQMLGYLAMIAQHTALIADRLMDLVVNEKERKNEDSQLRKDEETF